MPNRLVGREVFWLGGIFIVVIDPRSTELVLHLERELIFCGVHKGPAAMYGTVKEKCENGDITVLFLTAVGDCGGIDDETAYTFEVPNGMYVVVYRAN